MPKQDIAMSQAEIDGFLATQSAAVVVGLRGTGAPTGASARLHRGQGGLGFSVSLDDPIVSHLAEDDRACCVVEQFPSFYEIKGVMLHGRASRRDGGAPGEARFDLAVEKVVSFDFGKLPRSP
jgi:hypothetical protein